MPFHLISMTPDDLIRTLAERWAVQEVPGRKVEGVYFDTFDWRLYREGLALFVGREGGEQVWSLMERQSGRILAVCRNDGEPGMASSLPEPMGSRLGPLMEMRRLLPQVPVAGDLRLFSLLNEDGKTVLRLECQESPANLPPLVRILPLRGYEDEALALEQRLREEGAREVCPLDEALAALGRRGGDYSSKLNFALQPHERADLAAKHILLHLLGTIEANVEGVCNDTDSEFLHDLRVAVRRTRSALTQMKAVFEAGAVERYKAEFAWLGQVTGPARDWDVFLLKFEDYSANLPSGFREALAPFHRYLEQHQASDYRLLADHLRSGRFRSLLQEWRGFLESQPSAATTPANAGLSVKEVASARIHKMYRRVMREGRAIGDESPAAELHELRKSCKKLRYLMEFFQSLYPAGRIGGLIKALKTLLDKLGDHQDLQVQAGKLEAMAGEMRRSRAGTQTLLAMGMLIGELSQRQRAERVHFSAAFAQFSQERNRELFRELFRSNKEEVSG
ncbi:MAG: hypothetical protein A2286_07130 [Gammaproteobacteria bacterium RIFOXYA12_FULL_61_12]|nr:MAG: hypothetical protein A2514_02225 [Gammaproteobacteria bacterium RIFOXYD12_FULL_61_37]OGT94608.1 MAG: hypothetical protein A2286_07130 [Gammaproteobacteria bacterium RIFOXYA12_FULL_61_12]